MTEIRYDGPVSSVIRLTLEPVEVGGVVVKEKRVLFLLIESANYDESAFADPDALDITRKPNPHVGFGGGIHHCMGNRLARAEAEVVFRTLAERVSWIEPVGPVRREGPAGNLYASVPVALRAR